MSDVLCLAFDVWLTVNTSSCGFQLVVWALYFFFSFFSSFRFTASSFQYLASPKDRASDSLKP